MAGRETAIWVTGFGWLALVTGGFWLWERYDGTPGTVGARAVAADVATTGRWRLTVFAHPRCPCTRATLREAAELATAATDVSVRVLFVRPAGGPDGWERGEAWELATRIPGAEVACDATGAEARRFGAETSGQAVLTDPTGRAVFRGGLTQARGRTGASAGRRAVLAWVRGENAAPDAPVFGCPLFAPDE